MMKYLIFASLLFNLFLSSHSKGKTIFVDNKIDYLNCDRYNIKSRACFTGHNVCFKHLQSAIDFARYGDTVLIREGFYPEKVLIDVDPGNDGSLRIANFGNESVIIDGNNPDIGPLIEIRCDYVQIGGLKVRHSNTFGIISRKTSNINIENCEVSYSNDGGIVFVDGANISITGCQVHHNNYRGLQAAHEGISLHNVHGFEVAHCEVFDNREEGIDAKYGSRDGFIHHNSVYRNNGPNIYIDKANLIDVYNNVIHSAVSKAGISLNIESSWHSKGLAWSLQHVNIFNNIIYDNSGGIGFWLEEGDGEETQSKWDYINIFNNTIVNNARQGENRGGGIYIINLNPEYFGDHITISNNLFAENVNEISKTIWNRSDNELLDKVSIDHNLFIKNEGSDTFGRNPIFAENPGFEKPGAFDFQLLPGSKAVDAGSILNYPQNDFKGVFRPVGGKPDIGAFEYK